MSDKVFEADDPRRPVLRVVVTRVDERSGVERCWVMGAKRDGDKDGFGWAEAPTQELDKREVFVVELDADEYSVEDIVRSLLAARS